MSLFWLEQALQDLRFGLRTLAKNPAFTLVAVLTLALGIGANSAIFGVIDSLLLRRPDFKDLNRLVYIFDTNPQKVPAEIEVNASPSNFLDWREQAHSFDRMVGWRNWYFSLAGPKGHDEPESVRGVRVSPPFFEMLGVEPVLGRTFRPEEEQPGRGQVVILSNSVWKRRFGSDPAIVGKEIFVDTRPFQVIGVLAADFQFYQSDFDIWMPLTIDNDFYNRQNHSVLVLARLAPGASFKQAQAEMDAIAHRLELAYPDMNTGWGAKVSSLYPGSEARRIRPALLVLMGAAGFVLLIACANVANLLLSRAVARQREIAVRLAVGASRGRLVRQMLTESIVLALASGVAALVFARWGIELLFPLLPHNSVNRSIGRLGAAGESLDVRVLLFSVAIALTAAILFGAVPALKTTRMDFLRSFGTSDRRAGRGRFLIIAEAALSVVLLTGAALLMESFWRLGNVDPGFRSDRLLTMQIWLPRTRYPNASAISRFYEQILRRVEVLPGIQAAGAVNYRPFNGMSVAAPLDIEGRTRLSFDDFIVPYRVVTPGYIRMLGQRLVKGRDLVESDRPGSEDVAVINEAMVQRFWPGEDPIGKHIRPEFQPTDAPWSVQSTSRWVTVVGVVSNIKEFRLNEEPPPEFYISYRQFPSSFMFLMVRSATRPEGLLGPVQNAILTVDPEQPISNVRTMDEAISSIAPRFNVQLLGIFAVIAVLLSAIGVYGVTSYAMGQRKQEIAVRLTLGAQRTGVLRMVLYEGLRLAAIGVAAGILGSSLLTRAMASLLYGVSPTDVAAFTAASAIVLGVTVLACYLPVRRAVAVDPMTILRSE